MGALLLEGRKHVEILSLSHTGVECPVLSRGVFVTASQALCFKSSRQLHQCVVPTVSQATGFQQHAPGSEVFFPLGSENPSHS